MQFKIGDFVKLKEWEEFLEVIDVNNDSDSLRVVEEDKDGSKYYGWYPISLGFIKQGGEMKNSNDTIKSVTQEDWEKSFIVTEKQDEFQVGDVVWDIYHGKGKVSLIESEDEVYPVRVAYDHGDFNYYTLDGKFETKGPRALFFSEPKIEAAVTRPFVSTLVGKRVVVESESLNLLMACVVTEETHDMLSVVDESRDNYHWIKDDISAIYEVSPENLLNK